MSLEQHSWSDGDLELLDLLLRDSMVAATPEERILPRDPATLAPLSLAQQRLWFLSRIYPDNPAYTIAAGVRLIGSLNLRAFEDSLDEIARRHEILRSHVTVAADGTACLAIAADVRLKAPVVDLAALDDATRESRVRAHCDDAAATTFDLERGPLVQVRILRLSPEQHIVLLSLHHIIADGWSIGILTQELSVLYGALSAGRPSPLPELPIQYADFAYWQHGREAVFQAQLEYWRRQLADPPILELPTDRARPSVPRLIGASVDFSLPHDLSESLKALGQRRGATPFMALLAVFQVLLARYTGQNDILIGTPIANRNRREIEPLIGFFANTLVLRADLSGGPSFHAALDRTRDMALAAFAHQDLPFERLVGELLPDRDLGRNPLFQVMFTLQTVATGSWEMPGLTMAPLEIESRVAKFDLTLAMTEGPEGFTGGFEYDTDLFDAATIERMAEHFTVLLRAAVENPDLPVAGLSPLAPAEERRLLAEGSGPTTAYPRRGLAELFEGWAAATPDAPACEDAAELLDYRELNTRANRIAHLLRAEGVGLEDRVALVLERNVGLVAAVLGVLKAGAAYVNLNPDDPPARLAGTLADTAPRLILTETAYHQGLPAELPTLCLDRLAGRLAEAPATNPPPWAGAEHLAYLVFTSGSTGRPKGIAIPQGAVARLVLATDYVELTPADRIAQVSNSAFDAFTFEVFGALLNGARLVVIDRDTSLAPARLAGTLRDRGVSVMFLTTALFNQVARHVPEAFAPLRVVLFGGEACDPERVREVLDHGPPRHLLHVYGPSESTTFATWYPVCAVPPGATRVPIGRALANTETLVLDRYHAPVPPGAPGELCLGGSGLARGYWDRPGLTAEKFIPHPFHPGERLYRTGDKVRRRADGDLDFLGRFDDQVKIRGFRIEPAEIALTLGQHPAVTDAAVLVREDVPGQRQLVAYLCPAKLDTQTVRAWLAERLPEYMIPVHWVGLDRLPVTANGKIDRKSLPAPQTHAPSAAARREPRDDAERALVAVWSEVLGLEVIDLDGNYFHLGGDSISAIQVVSRLERAGWRLEIRDLFRFPSVAVLAPRLRRMDRQRSDEGPASGRVPLTPIQRWFFAETTGPLWHFNQSALLVARAPLDAIALEAALAALFEHHDALRMVFRPDSESVEQFNQAADQPLDFSIVDLRAEPNPAAAQAAHAAALQVGFDLAAGPLFKAALYLRSDADRLLLVAHHLVVDGISWRILLEDLERGYAQAHAGNPVRLGARTTSFKRWAESLTEYSTHSDLLAERAYWAAVEAGEDPFPPRTSGRGRFGEAMTCRAALSEEATRALLRDVHTAYFTEVPELLLAALGPAFFRWRGTRRLRLAMEGHGREPVAAGLEVERTVGWFTSLFPFLLDATAEDRGERIVAVKEAFRRIPRKGLGYGLLAWLTPEAARGEFRPAPAPRVSFNYLGQFADAEAGLFTLSDEPAGLGIAPELSRHHELDLVAAVVNGRLEMAALFDPEFLPEAEVAGFLADARDELLGLIAHCRSRERGEKSPSDFSVPALSLAEYRALVAAEDWHPADIEDVYPLSPMQEGLYFHHLYDPASTAYFIQMSYRPRRPPEPARFRAAWRRLCQRHPVLRTAFVHEGAPRPLQIVFKNRPPEIVEIDLRALPESEREARVLGFEAADRDKGFDLKRDPLVRLAVLWLGPERCHIVLSYHHLLLDGWCVGLVTRELEAIDAALALGHEPDLPAPRPYGDYIRWLEGRDGGAARAFWAECLAGYELTATLPGRTRNVAASYALKEHAFELPAELRGLAADLGVTLNSVTQCLWGLLLSILNGADDVLFGAVVSGRPAHLEGVETMVGLFINTIPVRLRLDGATTFAEFARATQREALDAEPHHHFPLAEIFGMTPLGRGLFDHALIFENFPAERSLAAGDSDGAELRGLHDRTHYDFDLMIVPGAEITARLHYNGELFPERIMAGVAARLVDLARRALAQPDQPLDELRRLPPAEWRRVVEEFNATDAPPPPYPTLVAWFEARARRHPEAPALAFGDLRLSYGELNRRANRLAHGLREKFGVRPEDRIGLLMDRSDRLMEAVLGVLKAGAAYVPIEPSLPPERVRFLAEDSGARWILCDPRHLERAPEGRGLVIADVPAERDDDPVPGAVPEHLAYVLYTSGSTGHPKGCLLEHRQLVHYLGWADGYYFDGEEGGHFGLYSPLSFDLTVTSLFLPLLRGKTLRVFPQEAGLDDILSESLAPGAAIDSIKLTPAHLSLLPELGLAASTARLAIVGGEALTHEQVARLWELNPDLAIYNEYGPTETTVGCIVKRVAPTDATILIGRPIANTRIYIVDPRLRPVPVGVPGEILIGGDGVCRGYLNRPELTAEKFIESPFRAGERLYRTGDLGRWLDDGEIDFLGRRDHQLKVRGHRIEPGEIEYQLRRHPAVRDALALASRGELIAYVAGAAIPVAELREQLAEHLPSYMIPAHFVTLERFPLNRNGKVDRAALPEPAAASRTDDPAHGAPRTPLERRLAAIWAEVLGVENIGIHDDFFALGGHSLRAMQIISRIHRDLGAKPRVRDLFERPSIAGLAPLLEHTQVTPRYAAIPPAPPADTYPLSHAQQRLWLEHRMREGSAYNLPEAFLSDHGLDPQAVDGALADLIARHEILRTAIVEIDGEPCQKVLPQVVIRADVVEIRAGEDPERRARDIVDREASRPFCLETPPLVRVMLLKMPDGRHVSLLTMHHIVGDAWSKHLFHKEFLALYEARRRGVPHALPPLRIQYKDFAVWERSRSFVEDEAFWIDRLAGARGQLPLPCRTVAPSQRLFQSERATRALAPGLVRALKRAAGCRKITVNTLLFAVFNLFLMRLTGLDDICVGMAAANRDHPDVENLIGFFVNLLPVRVHAPANASLEAFLEEVIQSTHEALEHQGYPYDTLIRRLNPLRQGEGRSFLNVVYAFQNALEIPAQPETGSIVETLAGFDFSFNAVKFDWTLVVLEEREGLSLNLDYDAQLFAAESIRTYLETLERFAAMAVGSE